MSSVGISTQIAPDQPAQSPEDSSRTGETDSTRVAGRDAALSVEEVTVDTGDMRPGQWARQIAGESSTRQWVDQVDPDRATPSPQSMPSPEPERQRLTRTLAQIWTSCETCGIRVSNSITHCDNCGTDRDPYHQKSWVGSGDFPSNTTKVGGEEQRARGLRKDQRANKVGKFNHRAIMYTRQIEELDANIPSDQRCIERELYCFDANCPQVRTVKDWMDSDWPDHKRTFEAWFEDSQIESRAELRSMINHPVRSVGILSCCREVIARLGLTASSASMVLVTKEIRHSWSLTRKLSFTTGQREKRTLAEPT